MNLYEKRDAKMTNILGLPEFVVLCVAAFSPVTTLVDVTRGITDESGLDAAIIVVGWFSDMDVDCLSLCGWVFEGVGAGMVGLVGRLVGVGAAVGGDDTMAAHVKNIMHNDILMQKSRMCGLVV